MREEFKDRLNCFLVSTPAVYISSSAAKLMFDVFRLITYRMWLRRSQLSMFRIAAWQYRQSFWTLAGFLVVFAVSEDLAWDILINQDEWAQST